MRLLFVVQRYGHEVAGGAERFARDIATGLVVRGHEVEVLTSRARDYLDWRDHFDEGTESIDGVTVHRLGVAQPRDPGRFDPLHQRVMQARGSLPLHLQESWMTSQGPRLSGFVHWLTDRAGSFDAAVFFTYLYWTTWAGVPVASAATTTVLHPTAHDEPPFHLPIHDATFRLPDAYGFLAEEERDLVWRRLGRPRPFAVTGMGIDLTAPDRADERRFRASSGLGDRPYLLYVGRLDPHKGAMELYDHFVAYKARNPGPLALAVVGDPVVPLAPHPDVYCTGFVDERTKHDAFAGCEALVQPSYFESFSIVLCEAWAHGRPALVQQASPVVAGQARRSGAGVPYHGFAEFEAAVELVASDPTLQRQLGDRGRRFVASRYSWDAVLDRYERFLASVLAVRPAARLRRPAASRR